jgi:hypothetical protein
MRLNEFKTSIQAGDKINISINIEHTAQFIRKNCSEFLAATNQILYRGIYGNKATVFIGSSPKDRVPDATAPEIQEKVDEKLREAGFSALRSNSIFCTGALDDASSYSGNLQPYVVCPINGFKFTWSPKIRDFTEEFAVGKLALQAYKKVTPGSLPPPAMLYLPTFKKIEKFLPLLELPASEFVDALDFRKNNIDAAINSGKEIMISGKYIAVRQYYFNEMLELNYL